METIYRDLLEWHRLAGHKIGDRPAVPDDDEVLLRATLVEEECDELIDAIDSNDLVGIAKESMDAIYVIVGTLLAYGINPVPLWREVHRSNVEKNGGPRRADGKILKPAGWRGPDIAGLLASQGPLVVPAEEVTDADRP